MPFNFPQYFHYQHNELLYPSKQQEIWTSQKQQVNQQSNLGIYKFGAAVGAIGAAGFIPYEQGNIWDQYLYAIKAAEEYSPAGVLRTLQLSNIFSPLASKVQNANLFITPELLQTKPTTQLHYLTQLIGGKNTLQRLIGEGVTLRKGSLFWGQSNEVALKYATAITSSGYGGAQRIGAAYARALNVKSNWKLEHIFANISHEGKVINPSIGGEAAVIVGGHSRLQSAYRYSSAIGTELVERFNRLLDMPFDTPPFSRVFGKTQEVLRRKLGIELKFGVESSGGLRMLGKLGLKYGIAGGGLVLGYKTLDWLTRQNSLLDNTILNEGITVGAATVGVRANLALSKTADFLGLHDYREKQEEIAPGSTSLQKLIAFPIMGAIAPAAGLYGVKVARMRGLIKSGLSPAQARQAAETALTQWEGGPLLEKLGTMFAKKEGFYSKGGIIGSLINSLAKPNKEGQLIYKGLGKLTPYKAFAAAGALLGTALVAPFLPGALIPSERPEELEALYSGKKEVPIRKGRWWSMGRTPYEGDKILTYLPHWYPRMRMRATEKGIYGENEDELSPWQKLYKREFTYELEQEHYYDRPYPQSSGFGGDLPLIGPLIENTIGRFIKKPLYMHTDEWLNKQGEVKLEPKSYGSISKNNEIVGGVPVSNYSPTQMVGEQTYRLSEMTGLPGFLFSSIKGSVTGRDEFFDQLERLQTSRRMFSFERTYWDKELGDLFLTNEAFRRLYPHRRRQIDEYNPLKNQMPDWMVGAGDKGPDLQHGDPFVKLPFGELRLPGKGFEARFPELKNVDPNDYPIVFRHKILADVAPYSQAFKIQNRLVRNLRQSKNWSEREEELYQQTMEQLKTRKNSEFQEYQYLSPMGEIFSEGTKGFNSEVLTEINNQQKEEKPSISKRLYGGYWEWLSHNAETAIEQLTPISPAAKLVHQRSAIESYERTQLYGSSWGFWQHPIRDFIEPFVRSTKRSLGDESVPQEAQEIRNIESYFDILKYIKATKLANKARINQDEKAAAQFESQKNQTLFGINPFSRNYRDILQALPSRERSYFKAFEGAETIEERERILEMVPNNEKALYLARWKIQEADQINKLKKQGKLTDNQLKKANEELDSFYEEARTEGFPTSKELFAQYLKTKDKGENYADWYRRQYLISKADNIPGADWVGWSEDIDLEDVKLKVVQTLGKDIHAFNLWESRERELAYKPEINEEVIEAILQKKKIPPEQKRDELNKLLTSKNMKNDIFIRRSTNEQDCVNIELKEDNSKDIEEQLQKALKS